MTANFLDAGLKRFCASNVHPYGICILRMIWWKRKFRFNWRASCHITSWLGRVLIFKPCWFELWQELVMRVVMYVLQFRLKLNWLEGSWRVFSHTEHTYLHVSWGEWKEVKEKKQSRELCLIHWWMPKHLWAPLPKIHLASRTLFEKKSFPPLFFFSQS